MQSREEKIAELRRRDKIAKLRARDAERAQKPAYETPEYLAAEGEATKLAEAKYEDDNSLMTQGKNALNAALTGASKANPVMPLLNRGINAGEQLGQTGGIDREKMKSYLKSQREQDEGVMQKSPLAARIGYGTMMGGQMLAGLAAPAVSIPLAVASSYAKGERQPMNLGTATRLGKEVSGVLAFLRYHRPRNLRKRPQEQQVKATRGLWLGSKVATSRTTELTQLP